MSDAIRTRLDLLRRRVHGAELARTGGVCASTAVGALAAWLAIDYGLITTLLGGGWYDLGARIVLDAALAWTMAGAVWRLVAAWRQRRGDDELAMRLERTHPALGGRLISTVQLLRDLQAGRRVGSPALVQALAVDARSRAEAIDHRVAWDTVPARRAALIGATIVVLGLGLAAWRHDISAVFVRRVALGSAPYPTATRILALRLPALVGRGDPLPITVEVDPTSQVPASAEATLRDPDGRTSRLRLERVAGSTGFTGVLPQAIDDLAIRARAGDGRWDTWRTVRVLRRPQVRELRLRLTYPEYLRMPPTTGTVGDLAVPVGTRVEVEAILSRAVAKAELHLSDLVAPWALSADGGVARGAFTVDADGVWSIGLVDAEGLDAGDPPRWSLVALPDRAPVISATFPPRACDVTRIACWPIRFTASDDHGLARIRLRWLVVPPGAEVESAAGEPGGQDGPVQTQGEIRFDLTPLQLATAAKVVWWLEAEDARTPQPNRGSSQRGVFTVVDVAEMGERMQRERGEIQDTIKALRDREREAQDGVEGIRKALKP